MTDQIIFHMDKINEKKILNGKKLLRTLDNCNTFANDFQEFF